ncbi:TPA: alpha/beta hydrolase, partial [Klebsiella pneumoniae]|nr:alpha/beta hydrolase [Klebsiella pneumoniae]
MNIKSALLSAAMAAVSVNCFADTPAPDRHVQQFLDALNGGGGKPIEQLSPQAARQVLIDAQKGATLPAADVSEKTISVDGLNITLKIVKPHNAQGTLPVFMFFHGGGWILGDFQTHERLIRDLVSQSGAAAVYVNYTPSPEAHFPVAINQAYAATRWVAENG